MKSRSRFRHLSAILAACPALALPAASHAQTITVFTNRAAFEAAIGGSRVTDDFSLAETVLGVTTHNGAISGGKWADIAKDPAPSTVWATPFGGSAFGGTWDTTVSGPGGGLAFELDFGGGKIVAVPDSIPGNSAANVFFGFTASQPFFNVRVVQINPGGGTLQETHTLDDLTVQVPAGFADAFFTQGVAGTWETAGHWTPATVPGGNQRAFITPTGGAVVSGPTAAATVRQLFLGNGAAASRLNLNAAGTLTASSGGTVRANSTLGGAGRFLGELTMATGSTLTVSDGQTLQVGTALANGFGTAGTITIGTGTLLLEDTGATPLGTLTTLAGGTLTALGGTAQIGSGDTLRGNGTLTGAFELLSGGTLHAQNGTLQVAQLSAFDGTVTVDAARTLTIGGTGFIGFDTLTIGAGGTLVATGLLQIIGSTTLGAGATISGASGLYLASPISHDGAQVFSAGTADLTIFNTSFTPDAADTLSGARIVLEGSSGLLLFSADADLDTAGNQIVLKGGGLFPQASLTLPATRNIEVTAQTGKVLALAGRNVVIEGNLSGAGKFVVTGSGDGTVRLTGTNTQAGGTDIVEATLEIASDAQLGGPNGVLLIGRENGNNDQRGKLRALGNLDIAATRSTTFRLATVDTNGFNVTFNQPTTGQGLTKQGEGVLRFNTVNTFNSGVNDIDIEAGTVRLGINEALGQPLVRLYDTTLDLNGFAQAVSTLSGSGTVQLGSGGALTFASGLNGNVVISGTGSVNFGQIPFNAADCRVLGENTFNGPVTITRGSRVTIKSTASLGAAGNPVLLDNGSLEADSEAPGPVVIGAAFPLTIGPGGASFGSNGQSLVIESLLAGNLPIGVRGGGDGFEARFAHPANTFTSNLDLGSNHWGAAVLGIVADGSLGAAANIVTLGYRFFDGETTRTDTGTLRAFADIAFPASRTLRMDGDGEGDGGGVFDTNGFNMTLAGPLTELHAGTPLRKTGTGTLTLNGANTHTGTTAVEAGTLVVNGSLGGETQVFSGGTLSGTGTTGSVSVSSGGTFAPGSSPSTLHTGNVTFDGGSTLALHFASPTSASQLAATGTVALNGEVELSLALGFVPATASAFVVVTNDGSDPLETFGGATFFSIAGNSLSEGETFTTGGADWTISYVGGTGNDVTLTVAPATAPPAELALLSFSLGTPPGGAAGKQIQGSLSGPPGAMVRMQRSSDLLEWTQLTTLNLNGGGTASFDVTDPLATDRAFYRLVTP
ncbi:MAG: hypothetical protein RLZZ522_876 [Verrucomicrobiota bacterium]